MTAETSLYRMLIALQHANLSDEDRAILRPALDRLNAGEVIALPETVITHIQRLHATTIAA